LEIHGAAWPPFGDGAYLRGIGGGGLRRMRVGTKGIQIDREGGDVEVDASALKKQG
jgi:hypothetical protein